MTVVDGCRRLLTVVIDRLLQHRRRRFREMDGDMSAFIFSVAFSDTHSSRHTSILHTYTQTKTVSRHEASISHMSVYMQTVLVMNSLQEATERSRDVLHSSSSTCFCSAGKTELAKQVARYMHKDVKKVRAHARTHTFRSVEKCWSC